MEHIQKITQIGTDLINGNISDFKNAVKKLSKLELLNLIEEYSLLSGDSIQDSLNRIKRLID